MRQREKVVRCCKGVCAPLSWPPRQRRRVWCRDDRGLLGAALKPSHYNQVECDLVNNIKPRCPDERVHAALSSWASRCKYIRGCRAAAYCVYCVTIKSWIRNEVSLTERYLYYTQRETLYVALWERFPGKTAWNEFFFQFFFFFFLKEGIAQTMSRNVFKAVKVWSFRGLRCTNGIICNSRSSEFIFPSSYGKVV